MLKIISSCLLYGFKTLLSKIRLANATEAAEERGVELGKEQGSKEMQIDIAKNLIKIGLDDTKISESTGLSLEDIAKLWTNN